MGHSHALSLHLVCAIINRGACRHSLWSSDNPACYDFGHHIKLSCCATQMGKSSLQVMHYQEQKLL